MSTKKTAKRKVARPTKASLGINYRGVSVLTYKTQEGLTTRFRSRITNASKGIVNKYLGLFETPEQAALAFNKAAKRMFRTESNARRNGFWNVVN